MSVLFFSNKITFFHVFLRAISFFQKDVPFHFPKRKKKRHFSFFRIKRHFFMHSVCHFIFSKSFSTLLRLQKQHFASLKHMGVPQKE